MLEAAIDGSDYLFINLSHLNTEKVQLTIIEKVDNLLKNFKEFHDKKGTLAGNFNLNFSKNLESAGVSMKYVQWNF